MTYPQQPGQYWGNQGYPGQGYPGPGYPGGGPPKRRNTGKIVAIVAIAMMVLGGAVAAVVVLTGDDKTSAADQGSNEQGRATVDEPTAESAEPADAGGESAALTVGQSYVDAIADKDQAAATDLTCDQRGPGGLYDLAGNADWEVQLTGKMDITTYGTATLEVEITTSYGNEDNAPGLLLEDRDGWCVPV